MWSPAPRPLIERISDLNVKPSPGKTVRLKGLAQWKCCWYNCKVRKFNSLQAGHLLWHPTDHDQALVKVTMTCGVILSQWPWYRPTIDLNRQLLLDQKGRQSCYIGTQRYNGDFFFWSRISTSEQKEKCDQKTLI